MGREPSRGESIPEARESKESITNLTAGELKAPSEQFARVLLSMNIQGKEADVEPNVSDETIIIHLSRKHSQETKPI